jgi:hypothetical protein
MSKDSPYKRKCFAWFDGLLGTHLFDKQNKGRRRKYRERAERAERVVRNERRDDIGSSGKRWHKHCRHDPAKWDSDE